MSFRPRPDAAPTQEDATRPCPVSCLQPRAYAPFPMYRPGSGPAAASADTMDNDTAPLAAPRTRPPSFAADVGVELRGVARGLGALLAPVLHLVPEQGRVARPGPGRGLPGRLDGLGPPDSLPPLLHLAKPGHARHLEDQPALAGLPGPRGLRLVPRALPAPAPPAEPGPGLSRRLQAVHRRRASSPPGSGP